MAKVKDNSPATQTEIRVINYLIRGAINEYTWENLNHSFEYEETRLALKSWHVIYKRIKSFVLKDILTNDGRLPEWIGDVYDRYFEKGQKEYWIPIVPVESDEPKVAPCTKPKDKKTSCYAYADENDVEHNRLHLIPVLGKSIEFYKGYLGALENSTQKECKLYKVSVEEC